MKMTLRTKVREAITKRFIPELKRRGFIGPDKISGTAIFHEFIRTADHGTDHLSVQFDKKQKPRFVLNIWIEPPDGIEGMIKREEKLLQGRIAPGKGVSTGAWFRADRPWWQSLLGMRSSLEEEAVELALARLDAIEDWFRNPRETDVIRVLPVQYRNPAKKDT